ncbi:MAG: hypothetical protein B6244_14230 [Candidatus Cloacimonetes bacterium 4572_55]|nr:MAG: hypothetical protein B6244_14230 [Candidatus Cloacimonetes bacterium 4572_55]
MTTEFLVALGVVTLIFLLAGALYGFYQVLQTVRRIETFIDHLDRDISPVIRQIEHLTRDLNHTVKNVNRQISHVETSLELLEETAEDISIFKNEMLSKVNKSSIVGLAAAAFGMMKGKGMIDKFMENREKKPKNRRSK